MYLTSYSDCLTGFHEPLSLPCRCHAGFEKRLARSLSFVLCSSEKVKVMLDRMKKILAMFKENRSKRHLNYNEEQIHKFEK